ncbi:MAG: hypothetical protein ABJC89_06995 [Acidobacteriota bacterium]
MKPEGDPGPNGSHQWTETDTARWGELAWRAAHEFSTPCYLSRWGPVVEAAEAQERRFAGLRVRSWLSFKTHPVRPLAAAWLRSGRGVEVVSEAELVAVSNLGYPSSQLLVNGIAKHAWLGRHRTPGLQVHFDSTSEIAALLPAAVSQQWQVGLRCHVPSERDARDTRSGGQFGLSEEEFDDACRQLRGAGVRVHGLHFHLGQAARRPGAGAESIACLVARCVRHDLAPQYFDCGGGINHASDVDTAFAELADAFTEATRRLPSLGELWLENGSHLTRGSAVLILRVLDTKLRSDGRYLICDGGRTNHALDADNGLHRLISLPERPGPKISTVVCGPTCMTDDRLGRLQLSAAIVPGDLIVWCDAGAYHLPWETRFSHGLSAVVWADDADQLSLARPRETPEQWSQSWTSVRTTTA